MVEVLLVHQADVNARNDAGAAPLFGAAFWGYKDIVELLLTHKADVNAKTSNGQTPLHGAVAQGHEDVAALLRQRGGHESIG